MTGVHTLDFESADETRTPDKARLDIVKAGPATVARMVMEPGWSWSESIKPVVGTASCQARHVGFIQSGTLRVRHEDGSQAELTAGDAYIIEPGHDAEVVGNERVVAYEFEPQTAQEYARG